jgi:putative hemolysin
MSAGAQRPTDQQAVLKSRHAVDSSGDGVWLMDSVALEFVLIAIGILANAVFASSEFALVSSRISRLAELRKRSIRGAAAAIQLKESPETFLATIQIAITAVGTLTSAVGGAAAVEAVSPWLMRVGLGPAAPTIALGMVILLITYASLVVGELTPRRSRCEIRSASHA